AAWLHRIVVNRALDLGRRERASVPLEAVGDLASEDRPGVDRELLAALAALPAERRAVVVLRHWLGHSLAETAEILDLPLGTVQSRLARGLRELRERLGAGA